MAIFLPRKISAIAKFLSENDARVGLMSWAVWHFADKEQFESRFRHDLEFMLQHQFDDKLVWSMDEWAVEIFKHRRKKVSRDDMFDMFGKQEVLLSLARNHPEFKGHEVVLFDDAVEHMMEFRCPSNECNVKFINIDTMLKVSV